MNQPGKNIVYLLLGLFTAAVFISSCTGRNEPDDFNPPADKVSLSISFNPAQQTRAGNGVRGTEIDEVSESKIYSLAVLVFKENGELDGKKFIVREPKSTEGAQKREDYVELSEIKDIALTAGLRDVYIIANAPDGHFSDVTNRTAFMAKVEELSAQKMYGQRESGTSGDIPIGGVTDDRFTNLVMTQSFTGLPINSGAEKHYLGYTGNGGRPDGVTTGTPLLREGNPIKVELVRLVARVAIQKIAFALPDTLTFDTGHPTSIYNHYVDTVFLLNAKTVSSYFPGVDGFPNPADSFGHGNTIGYEFLKGKLSISYGSTYAEYLYKPINFPEYDITNNQIPLWFYAFENDDSETYPTAFVIGVKYQYINPGETDVKAKKVYYPVVVNANGGGTGGNQHYYIKRNNQYGIQVTIKGLGGHMTDYSGSRSAALRAMNALSEEGVLEIEETVGPNLFPWTGNVYK